jgi:transcription initiation factor TFIIIB Brf1 subunit/transcription initiation factor TFIIB
MTLPANDKLDAMLAVAGIPKKSSYNAGEVCRILGISSTTFWRKTEKFELCPRTGAPLHTDALDSYILGTNKRVSYGELADYLARNRTWHRRNAVDERQMDLFEDL